MYGSSVWFLYFWRFVSFLLAIRLFPIASETAFKIWFVLKDFPLFILSVLLIEFFSSVAV